MKEYLEYLTKHLPVRFSKRQKQNAAAWISDEMEKQGYLCECQKYRGRQSEAGQDDHRRPL